MKISDITTPFPNTKDPFISSKEAFSLPQKRFSRALGTDFPNYVIGRLIPDRRNWDNDNPEYVAVLHQIEQRVFSLGYSEAKFAEIDKRIANAMVSRIEGRNHQKTERYGKKYSWIAYFEMYGTRFDSGTLPDWKQERVRPSDADLDPTFPDHPLSIKCSLNSSFSEHSQDGEWLKSSALLDYKTILINDSTITHPSPFVLLYGNISQKNMALKREFEVCIRSVLVKSSIVRNVLRAKKMLISFSSAHSMPAEYYSFAGEMLNPKYPGFAESHKFCNQPIISDASLEDSGHALSMSIDVEIPTVLYEWEYYHSQLNQVSGIPFLSPSICNDLKLHGIASSLDLFDSSGECATIFRTLDGNDLHRSKAFYLRSDLLLKYLKNNSISLVSLVWGMRSISRKGDTRLPNDIIGIYQSKKNQFYTNELFSKEKCIFHNLIE